MISKDRRTNQLWRPVVCSAFRHQIQQIPRNYPCIQEITEATSSISNNITNISVSPIIKSFTHHNKYHVVSFTLYQWCQKNYACANWTMYMSKTLKLRWWFALQYSSWVCVSVCYSSSHLSSVRSSHKGHHLLNGQWRSEISRFFLWKHSVAKLEREKANMQIHNSLLQHDRSACSAYLGGTRRCNAGGVYRLSHAIYPCQTLRELARDQN